MAADKTIRILLVDDQRTVTMLAASMLRQLGFAAIDEAADGGAALAKLRDAKYDLILSDWNMAPMDGLAFLQAVRADPATAALPFLMVSTESRPEKIAEARTAGATGYMTKPFSAAGLRDALAAILGPL